MVANGYFAASTSLLVRALKRVDLPTLGSPPMPIERLPRPALARKEAGVGGQALEVGLGPGARVRDDLGGAQGAQAGALDGAHAVRQAVQEARSEEVTGAGRVDHLPHRGGRNLLGSPWQQDGGALRDPRHDDQQP